MNAERLHAIARILKQELSERRTVASLNSLVNALQQIVQQNNQSTQQNLVSSRDSFYKAVTDTPSDAFTPAWRQILIEMGGDDLFGKNLKQWVEKILAENQMTPGVAQQQLAEILDRLQKFSAALDQLISASDHFKIGSEKLAPGEGEIALLIPREAVHDRLEEFTGELDDMKFILNTFSELATGHKDALKIRTLSSSGLMVFLAAGYGFAAIVAKAIDFIVGQYKKILEIKKLQLELDRLELPEEISEKAKEHANTLMEKSIDTFTLEIVQEYHTGKDGERKNELRNAVKLSLNKIANKIDHGFNFEVRIEPPKALDKSKESEEIQQAVQTIKAASANMQYLKLEGPPILALPEKIEPRHNRRVTVKKAKKEPGKEHQATEPTKLNM
jgi:hypothetical protein